MSTEDKAIDGISAFKFLAHAPVYEKKEKSENEEEERKKKGRRKEEERKKKGRR